MTAAPLLTPFINKLLEASDEERRSITAHVRAVALPENQKLVRGMLVRRATGAKGSAECRGAILALLSLGNSGVLQALAIAVNAKLEIVRKLATDAIRDVGRDLPPREWMGLCWALRVTIANTKVPRVAELCSMLLAAVQPDGDEAADPNQPLIDESETNTLER